jgi:hypothetical protein
MAKPFQGVVNVDIKKSTPDWGPYAQPVEMPWYRTAGNARGLHPVPVGGRQLRVDLYQPHRQDR